MSPTIDQGRRRLLAGLAAVPAAALVPGCRLTGPPGPPCDPPNVNGVDWVPDWARPVAWGEEHLDPGPGGPPRPLSIYYPSHRFIPPRPMLRHCLAKWPLVLFLHGFPPQPLLSPDAAYRRRWFRVPIALARSGYVVVAPFHTPSGVPQPAEINAALADIDWIRNQWSERHWVRPDLTAVAGHSRGGVLAAALASLSDGQGRPRFDAIASLAGDFGSGGSELLRTIRCPAFFMYTRNIEFGGLGFENLDDAGRWDSVPTDKYAAVHEGAHFDYLEPGQSGTASRGPCRVMGGLAADLVTLFIARNLQGLAPVTVELFNRPVPLTDAQRALAVSHLSTINRTPFPRECKVDLRWRVGLEMGGRPIPAI